MPVTRRGLLNGLARLGGAGAVYEALALWDFLKPPPASAASLELPRNSGNGKSVAILGAGVAGLCAAYELDQAGYDCIILEASRRAGGRSLTLRRGDSFRELGHEFQTCAFDEGLYLNAGPGRIPHHHVQVIDYCRRFGVALQPYIFASRANLVHTAYLGNPPGALRSAGPCRRAPRQVLGNTRIGPAGLGRRPREAARDARDLRGPDQDRERLRLPQQVGPCRLRRPAGARERAGQGPEPDGARRAFALAGVGRLHLPRHRLFLADLPYGAGRGNGQFLQGLPAASRSPARPARSRGSSATARRRRRSRSGRTG